MGGKWERVVVVVFVFVVVVANCHNKTLINLSKPD